MNNTLRVLLIEGNIYDAEKIKASVTREKPGCIFQQVMLEDEFLQAIDIFHPDVVISDNTLPAYSAVRALHAFKKRSLAIPFILVSSSVTEESALDILKAGADDYLFKDRLTRLPSAIDSAIQRKKAEAEKRAGDERIRFHENLLSSVGQAVIATDMNGRIIYWNFAAEQLYGWKAEEVTGKDIFDVTCEDQYQQHTSTTNPPLLGDRLSGECWMKRKDGSFFAAFLTESPFYSDNGDMAGIISVCYDLTEQKFTEKKIREMEMQMALQKVEEQRKISRAIINAQEEEKNYIGLELHDNINQVLAGAKMFLGLAGERNKELKNLLNYPMELLDHSIAEIRRLTHKQVTPLKNINLKDQLDKLLESLNISPALDIHFAYSVPGNQLADELKLNIYRIVQEQLSNILKHANAKTITIKVVKRIRWVTVSIQDDGKGFNLVQQRKGIGISNMINRTQSYNGSFHIASKPNEGCRVTVRMPV